MFTRNSVSCLVFWLCMPVMCTAIAAPKSKSDCTASPSPPVTNKWISRICGCLYSRTNDYTTTRKPGVLEVTVPKEPHSLSITQRTTGDNGVTAHTQVSFQNTPFKLAVATNIATPVDQPHPYSQTQPTSRSFFLPADMDTLAKLFREKQFETIAAPLQSSACSLNPCPSILIRAMACLKVGKPELAYKHLSALQPISLSEDDTRLFYYCMGEACLKLEKLEAAESCYQRLLDLTTTEIKDVITSTKSVAAKTATTLPSLSLSHTLLARILRKRLNMMNAIEHFQAAISEAKSADCKKDELSAHTRLGNLYHEIGSHQKALDEYQLCYGLAEALNNHVSLGWAHGNLGSAYLGLSKTESAIEHLHKALEIALDQENTPAALSRAYNNLGTAYQSSGNLTVARAMFESARTHGKQGSDKAGLARAEGASGNLRQQKNEHKQALDQYTQVIRITDSESIRSIAYNNRGCLYYKLTESKLDNLVTPENKITASSPPLIIQLIPEVPDSQKHVTHPYKLSEDIKQLYQDAINDLTRVIEHHEQTFSSMRGRCDAQDLAVNLFETNSRTFHLLQDCYIRLGDWEHALLTAEQSRARSMGEILNYKAPDSCKLTFPLSMEDINSAVNACNCPVIYTCFTGDRLIIIGMKPHPKQVVQSVVMVPLKDDCFSGSVTESLFAPYCTGIAEPGCCKSGKSNNKK